MHISCICMQSRLTLSPVLPRMQGWPSLRLGQHCQWTHSVTLLMQSKKRGFQSVLDCTDSSWWRTQLKQSSSVSTLPAKKLLIWSVTLLSFHRYVLRKEAKVSMLALHVPSVTLDLSMEEQVNDKMKLGLLGVTGNNSELWAFCPTGS